MKKQRHNVHGEATASAPRGKDRGYVGMVCEHVTRGVSVAYPSHDSAHADGTCKTEGEKNGSVVGCNANNSQVSARTANCNNHAGNGNNNYAGAFAVNTDKGKPLTSGAASSKTKDGHVATGGHGRCDYGSQLPFWDSCENAESNVSATVEEADVMEELKTANRKRKLKNLRRFFVNRTIIEMAFDRTMDRTDAPDSVIEAWTAQKQKVCDRIERELRDMTYTPKPPKRKVIHKKGKGDKDRNADVSAMYDRIVQTLTLLVIEKKLRNMMVRNVYSGIKGRSLLSKDRRFCMVNKIRHWVKGHPDMWVGQTDIRHFYETLQTRIVLGELFKVVVCPYTRWLLARLFIHMEYLPIGGCLSQLLAMFVLVIADREVLRRYKVELFGFGDNRLMCGEKKEVRAAMSFLMSFYAGRFVLKVKGDYQMRRVVGGFRFCKYDYKQSYVHLRAEMRRRAIRGKAAGQKHYAGYRGMLLKTDSARLRHMIENNYMKLVNKHGMTVTTQRGDKVKLRDLADGSEVVPVEFSIEPSEAKAKEGKEGYMVRLTYIHLLNGQKRLCHSTEGSEEVVEFFRLVANGKAELHQRLHVKHDGTKVFFDEYHTTKQEACELICAELGI